MHKRVSEYISVYESSSSSIRSSLLVPEDVENADNCAKKFAGSILPDWLKIKLAHDCCKGVAFLHSKTLMHCDIKSLNFLVTENLVVKLSDLGEARTMMDIRGSDAKALPRNINWAAPELLRQDTDELIDSKSDVWSLCMVIVEILSGEVPFDSGEYRKIPMQNFLESTFLKNTLKYHVHTPFFSAFISSIHSFSFFLLSPDEMNSSLVPKVSRWDCVPQFQKHYDQVSQPETKSL